MTSRSRVNIFFPDRNRAIFEMRNQGVSRMEVAGRVRSTFLLIQQVQVEIHLAGMFRLERNDFHVKDHEGLEEAVVEERVNEIFFAAKNEAVLPADKAEAIAELQNEPLQVRGEPTYL